MAGSMLSSRLSGTPGSEDGPKKYLELKPLKTKADMEFLLRSIHKEFLAKVEPVDSGLQDFLYQRRVLTDSDNESLTGPHLPVRLDKARHLFKILFSTSLEKFVRDALPVLCEKYDYIIPPCFWKVEVVEGRTAEHAQSGTTNQGKEGETAPEQTSPGQIVHGQTSRSGRTDGGGGGEDDVCLRCAISTTNRVRPTTVADFLFQRQAVSFAKYCQLTKDHRLTPTNWPSLFSAMKSLPVKDGEGHRAEMASILRSYSLPEPVDLLNQMRQGFPCRCHRHADGVGFYTMKRNQREVWCEHLRRWQEQNLAQKNDISSPSAERDDRSCNSSSSNNSSSNNNSSNNNSSISSYDWNPGTRQKAAPPARTPHPCSGSQGSGGRKLVRQQLPELPEQEAGEESAKHPNTEEFSVARAGLLSWKDLISEDFVLGAFPAGPASRGHFSECAKARMLQIYHSLRSFEPEFPPRQACTLNLRSQPACSDDPRGNMNTWHGAPFRMSRTVDSFDLDYQCTYAASQESFISVVLKGLEDARSCVETEGTIEHEGETCWEDASSESEASVSKLDTTDSHSCSSALGSETCNFRSTDCTDPECYADSDSGSDVMVENKSITTSPDVDSEKQAEGGIATERQMSGNPKTGSTEVPQLHGTTQTSPTTSDPAPKQGRVAQPIGRFQPPPAPENVSHAYSQLSQQEGTLKGTCSTPSPSQAPDKKTLNILPVSTERLADQRSKKDAGKELPTVSSISQSHKTPLPPKTLDRDSVSSAQVSTSPGRDSDPKVTRQVKCPTSLALENSRGDEAVRSTEHPLSYPNPLTSPISLLPTSRSPDDQKCKHLEKVLRKGHFEKFPLAMYDLPRSEDHEPKDRIREDDVIDEETEVRDDETNATLIQESSDLSPSSRSDDLNVSANLGQPLRETLQTDQECYMWEGVKEAKKNRNLLDFYKFASKEVTDVEHMKDFVRKAVITDVRTREDLTQQLSNYASLESRFKEIRQKKPDAFQPYPKHNSAGTDSQGTHSPPEPPVADAATTIITTILRELSTLFTQMETLCNKMLVFTRVCILCIIYLHTTSRLTSETSRIKAMIVVRDAIMLSEWTSLQGWQAVDRFEGLVDRLSDEDRVSCRVTEAIGLMKKFFESA